MHPSQVDAPVRDPMHPRRIQNRVIKDMNRAIQDFGLVQPNDKILVALSGGKDSYAMLWALQSMQASAPFKFDLVAYHLDQAQPGHNTAPIEQRMIESGLPYEIEVQDTYSKVLELTPPGKAYCSACSRFRRAILYKAAHRHGCNKVALGHHADDLVETLLMSILFSGQIKSMPAKLRSDDGSMVVIRPLAYVKEADLIALSTLMEFPIVPCNLCGSQATKRQYVKGLIRQLQDHSPHIRGNILNALSNVQPTHLLDAKLHPYLTEEAVGTRVGGDAVASSGIEMDAPAMGASPIDSLLPDAVVGHQALSSMKTETQPSS